MKQISSKLNMYTKGVSVMHGNIERAILNIIIFSSITLVFLYMIFLGTMVKNIIERRSFEADARNLSSEVRDLEATYLSMSSNVDLALSYSLGFQEVKTTFTTRKSLGFGQNLDSVKTAQNDI